MVISCIATEKKTQLRVLVVFRQEHVRFYICLEVLVKLQLDQLVRKYIVPMCS